MGQLPDLGMNWAVDIAATLTDWARGHASEAGAVGIHYILSHCSPTQLEDSIRNQIKDDNTVTDRICGQDMHFDGPASLCPSPDAIFPVVEVDDRKRYIHHEINLNLMARSINLAKHVNSMSSCLLQLRCLGSLNGFLPLQEDVKSASTLYSVHNSPVS
jgi:hypothetical protein